MTREEIINKLGRRTAYDFEHEAASMLQRDGEAIAALAAERDQLLARIEDTDSACADYAFAGAHTAREIIEKLHDRIRGYKTDRDLLAEANDQLRAELAACQQDAERYRWLRLHSWVEEDATPAILFSRGCDQQNPEFLDEAIDEAREGEGETK